MKIRKNDTVKIIAGKDRGKTGKVERVFPKEEKVLIAGVNLITKTKKQTKKEKGGFVKVERPVHVSNVMLLDPKDNVPTRVRIERDENGKPFRVTKKSGTKLS